MNNRIAMWFLMAMWYLIAMRFPTPISHHLPLQLPLICVVKVRGWTWVRGKAAFCQLVARQQELNLACEFSEVNHKSARLVLILGAHDLAPVAIIPLRLQ
jgi:hypothetical protein